MAPETATAAAPAGYPAADRLDLVDDLHGLAVADPYRWLEDADDPRTRAWSAAQDDLYQAARRAWPGRDELAGVLHDLLRTGAVGPPVWRPGRVFATRREPDAEHPVLTVAPVDDDGRPDPRARRVLVDPQQADPTGTTTLDGWSPSREGDLVAVQLSYGGSEDSELVVLDTATGDVVDGPLDRTRYSPVAWLPRSSDGRVRFVYVRRLPPDSVPAGEEQYHRRVYVHEVGTPADEDVEVAGSGLPKTTSFGLWARPDGRWLVVSAADGTAPRTDVWLADLAAAPAERPHLVPVAVGVDARTSAWVGRDDRLYLLTDLDAPRGRLCTADPADPGPPAAWRTLLPEDPEAVLDDVALLDGPSGPASLLAVARTRHALSELTLHVAADGRPGPAVPELPGLGTLGGLVARPEGGAEAWAIYTDTATPGRVLRLDVSGATESAPASLTEWERPPGDPGDGERDITATHLAATSADGTMVRVLVVARTDAVVGADGGDVAARTPAPTVLYGYGGFGISMTPGYSASVLSWVRAGGVWATAQLRGGGEQGESWHRAGMLGSKQAVFDDYLASADLLVADGWTTREQLALSGGSNGGLLVGAALVQRPAVAAAVLCSAPVLDMARFHLHGLGQMWRPEYGDPEDPEALGWLLAYSPYHNVRDGTRYPAVLFSVFDGDTRVDPLHARKTCAALQHATTAPLAESPVLIRTEPDVGHAARSVSRSVAAAADGLAFLAARTGLEWPWAR